MVRSPSWPAKPFFPTESVDWCQRSPGGWSADLIHRVPRASHCTGHILIQCLHGSQKKTHYPFLSLVYLVASKGPSWNFFKMHNSTPILGFFFHNRHHYGQQLNQCICTSNEIICEIRKSPSQQPTSCITAIFTAVCTLYEFSRAGGQLLSGRSAGSQFSNSSQWFVLNFRLST